MPKPQPLLPDDRRLAAILLNEEDQAMTSDDPDDPPIPDPHALPQRTTKKRKGKPHALRRNK